ncbi:zinc ABC transporter substrate-binding protein [Candidatus Dependentiae bacterium]|nr:zinc ABC transporter substrate-binding protein [Candidatus Dependentiae bacterium]
MKKFPLIIIFATLLISLIVIARQAYSPFMSNKYRVVCTTTFLADALKYIAGDTIEIISLMGPGIDPHLYKATEQDMHHIAHANLIMYQGLHLEGKMAELFKGMKSYKPTYAVCKALHPDDLRVTSNTECYDPHVWFSVPLWIKIVRYTAQILDENNPGYTDFYHERCEEYCAELEKLDQYVCAKAAELPAEQRILITAHDAFGYFGKTYGFTVIGLQGISTDSDISTASVEHLAQYIATNNVSTIFTELSVPHKSIEALQQAVARYNKKVAIGPELYTDSLGDETSPADTYRSMIQYTIQTLVESLKQKE